MKQSIRHFIKIAFSWQPAATITSDTAWLNGMRGLAAFLVMMNHFSLRYLTFFAEAPFGARVLKDQAFNGALPFRKDHRLWAPWRLPILRIFMVNGGGQVAVFFVISGFVLTWSFLKMAEAGRLHDLFGALGSAVFRRWSRLYLPCVAIVLIYATDQNLRNGIDIFTSTWTYLGQAALWTNPYRLLSENLRPEIQIYNDVIWTIPYEFSGSIFVYVLVLVLGRYSYARRQALMLIAITGAFFSLNWHLWLFGVGMLLADYARSSDLFAKDRVSTYKGFWVLTLLAGLIVLSYPLPSKEWYTRPFYDLEVYVPLPPGWRVDPGSARLWLGVGGIMVTTSICHLPWARHFFESPFMQHLGKVSFMLYLIHRLFEQRVGQELQWAAYTRFCDYQDDIFTGMRVCEMNPVFHVAILVGIYVVNIIGVLVASNVLERFVDRPITAFGKVVDKALLRESSRSKAAVVVVPEQELLLAEPVSNEDLELGVIEKDS